MGDKLPFVSVIIPCRNEDSFIARCLESLIGNDYPKERMEILVVDGSSTDHTKDIASRYSEKHSYIRLLDNPRKTTPVAMNIGINAARGELVTKSDAHSAYPPNYISTCVRYMAEFRADVVGGEAIATPGEDSRTARAIVLSLRSTFGTGGSRFRMGVTKPVWADTAFGPLYRKALFGQTGLYNEALTRSQDMDMSIRIKRAGGRILLVPEIAIAYYPKTTLSGFFQHNLSDGFWAILPVKYGTPLFRLRHLLPLGFAAGILISAVLGFVFWPFWVFAACLAGLYLFVSLFFSSRIAFAEHEPALIPMIVGAFTARHLGYGLGSLFGLVKLVL